ncbi:MAG: BPL-N domain-containing protein [Bacteroidales bacterium]
MRKQKTKVATYSFFSLPLFILTLLLFLMPQEAVAQGFYKDIFMDGGIRLTSRKDLPAARRLDLSIEYFASSKGKKASDFTLQDTLIQTALFTGSDDDTNGVLLYPDGAPRFKAIYVNGGFAPAHAISLGESGKDNIKKFVKEGGSYVGTCAGMFLASLGNKHKNNGKEYLHIWPGWAYSTLLSKTPIGHFIEKGSPLLKYYDFGGDMHVDSVYHNGGGFAYLQGGLPEGTEILTRYDYTPKTGKQKNHSIHNEISTWAWKESESTGRILLCGSHPEGVTSGERLDLMSSFLLYAIDGVGAPKVKGELQNGVARIMDKKTEDNNPDFTRIGDKQYHHFTVDIPKKAKNIRVSLEGAKGYDLNLYLNRGAPAFKQDANMVDISKGAKKSILNKKLEPGVWYIGVECDTTVESRQEEWGWSYTGDLSVLNGVPYTIKVEWD